MKDIPMITIDTRKHPATATQVGGDHYRKYKIQPIDFIEENNLGFTVGNIIKYVVRYEDKDGLKDLKKARHYLDMLIERRERQIDTLEDMARK